MADATARRRPVATDSLVAGALADLIKISTLGQPFKVLKTHMGVERKDSLRRSVGIAWSRGGLRGLYQGLWPWGVIECATKGAVLQVAGSEVEYQCLKAGLGAGTSGAAAGMAGGIVQSYTTMGITTFMTTIEVTRAKASKGTGPAPSTMQVATEIVRRDGILGMYRGVHALALRQMTNWGSRFGIARMTESVIDKVRDRPAHSGGKKPAWEKILASSVGGALACWNNPIEVIRVEQQKATTVNAGQYVTIRQAASEIMLRDGLKGFFRGGVPRVCLSIWATVAQVAGGDHLKALMRRQRETQAS